MWTDTWTVVLRCRRSAQFEHTLVVTDDGFEVLTQTSSGLFSRILRALDEPHSTGCTNSGPEATGRWHMKAKLGLSLFVMANRTSL